MRMLNQESCGDTVGRQVGWNWKMPGGQMNVTAGQSHQGLILTWAISLKTHGNKRNISSQYTERGLHNILCHQKPPALILKKDLPSLHFLHHEMCRLCTSDLWRMMGVTVTFTIAPSYHDSICFWLLAVARSNKTKRTNIDITISLNASFPKRISVKCTHNLFTVTTLVRCNKHIDCHYFKKHIVENWMC